MSARASRSTKKRRQSSILRGGLEGERTPSIYRYGHSRPEDTPEDALLETNEGSSIDPSLENTTRNLETEFEEEEIQAQPSEAHPPENHVNANQEIPVDNGVHLNNSPVKNPVVADLSTSRTLTPFKGQYFFFFKFVYHLISSPEKNEQISIFSIMGIFLCNILDDFFSAIHFNFYGYIY
jgi:hypothetical protein